MFKTPLTAVFIFLITATPLLAQNSDSLQVGTIHFKSATNFYLNIENEGIFESKNLERSVQLPPGRYVVRFHAPCNWPKTYIIQVEAGITRKISHVLQKNTQQQGLFSESCIAKSPWYFHHKTGKNYAVKTEGRTEIFIDNVRQQGNLFSLQPGKHQLRLQQNNRTIEKSVVIDQYNASQLNIDRLYIHPERLKYVSASLIPGVAQLYDRRHINGKIQLTSFIALTTISSAFYLRIEILKADYDEALNALDKNLLSDDYLLYYNDLQQIDKKIQRSKTIKNIALTSSVLLYGYNLLDAYVLNRPIFRTKDTPLKNIEINLTGTTSEIGFKAKIDL